MTQPADQPTARTRRPPPPFRVLALQRRDEISPRLLRLVLAGDELEGFARDEPAASIRVVVAWPGDEFEVPTWTGNEFLLADGRRPALRTFTPVAVDQANNELTLDVVRHPGGAISSWAENAPVGTPVAVAGPGRGETIDPSAKRYVLFADETAIPAMRQMLAAIEPSVAVIAHIEVTEPAAEVDLGAPERPATWSVRPADALPGATMIDAAQAHTTEPGDRFWAAGEAAAVQAIRKHLFDALGVPRNHTSLRGYWKVPRQ